MMISYTTVYCSLPGTQLEASVRRPVRHSDIDGGSQRPISLEINAGTANVTLTFATNNQLQELQNIIGVALIEADQSDAFEVATQGHWTKRARHSLEGTEVHGV